jgi:hypothetical protein
MHNTLLSVPFICNTLYTMLHYNIQWRLFEVDSRFATLHSVTYSIMLLKRTADNASPLISLLHNQSLIIHISVILTDSFWQTSKFTVRFYIAVFCFHNAYTSLWMVCVFLCEFNGRIFSICMRCTWNCSQPSPSTQQFTYKIWHVIGIELSDKLNS